MQGHDMDSLVSPFDHVPDLNHFDLPFEDSTSLGHRSHVNGITHLDNVNLRQASSGEIRDVAHVPNKSIQDETQVTNANAQEAPKKPGISRSTYFRAKRNLKSHGSVRSAASGKQIGRPQKLDTHAEKVIQGEMERNPTAELKQLQALVHNKCGITVSLSSISRRLKALGRSPSQNIVQSKRISRKKGDEPLTLELDSLDPLAHEDMHSPDDHFASIPQLEDYDAMQHAFAVNLRNHENLAYQSGMNLDMLDMQTNYAALDENTLDDGRDSRHIYKYQTYDKDHDLNDYSAINSDIYRHGDERQMLFDETDLNNGASWQEVLSSSTS